ncbi:MAG: large repetitive protein [Frankiales bacterium]|nr:large repetitive protein [Frankiales bacterium]MDX6211983.1 large repetitive protein [Frankiales bacterium]
MRVMASLGSTLVSRTRITLRWVAATSVALSLMVAAAPAQAATPATSHLRSTVAPATVLIGGSVVVSGAVSPTVSGSPVVLQRLVSGKWVTLGQKASGKKGTFSFAVHATGKASTWSLRVIRRATSKATAVVGKTLKVHLTKTAYKLSAATVTKVNAGEPVVVTGKVSPKATGRVYLQWLHLGKWRTLSSAALTSSTYKISKLLPAKAYALRVVKLYTTAIATGHSKTLKVTVFPAPGTVPRPPGSPALSLRSPDDALLALPDSRLVFSTVKSAATPAKSFTFTNTGSAAATVSGLSVQGADASSFGLAPGQPTSFSVPAGGSATVSIVFHPTATTNCPVGTAYPDAYKIGDSLRLAGLVFSTTDPALRGGNGSLGGVNSCAHSGNNEPVLDQVLAALGYSDVVTGAKTDRRFIGQTPNIPGTDEITARYFRAANPAAQVSLVPLAHYSTTGIKPYQATGWYAQGAKVGADGTCNAACHQIWAFPGEGTVPDTSFQQNQKLLPVPVGSTTFSPGGPFGLFNGEYTNVNWSDDTLNVAHQCTPSPTNCKYDGTPVVPTKYLHDMRVYPAYGPGHVAIPNTYLVAIDVSRLADKNNDFQDIVLILRNVVPAG